MERKVIDVSHWTTITDWNKLKSAVAGVIMKATDGTRWVDEKFGQFADKCTQLGIPFGVYCYSQAKSAQEGLAEAEYLLKAINGYKLSYPVYFDSEQQGTNSSARVAAQAFCERIEKAGYWAGIYASESWFNANLNGFDKYTKWVAKYGVNDGQPHTKPSVSGVMGMWQYTDKGRCDGTSGNVDLNIQYQELGGGPKIAGTTISSNTNLNAAPYSNEFVDKYVNSRIGRSIDDDGAYGTQCVDGFRDWNNYIGVGAYPTGGPKGSGSAYHYWLNRNDVAKTKNNYDFITDWRQLRNGDWVMWPKSAALPYGHIAMYYNGKAFGQNQNGRNDGFTLQNWDFSKMCGALRWKKLITGSGSTPTPVKKSNDVIAQEVIDGKWGDGDTRKSKLQAAGYDYNAIQTIVNQKLSGATKKSNDVIAQEVIDGKWGSGDDRKRRLQAAGYNYDTIQSIVNQKLGANKKSNEVIAQEVMDGKWGNGDDRKRRLQAAGYDYNAIQSIINGKYRKSNTVIAHEVIAGKWGNGAVRKQKLQAAGYDYNAIQKIVNSLI